MLQKLFKKLRRALGRIVSHDSRGFERDLARLERQARRQRSLSKSGVLQHPVILFAHSFSIYDPSFVHDKLLSLSLLNRGARIVPVFCDAIQNIECNVFGGVWGGGDKFPKNCRFCVHRSKQLWSHIPGAVNLSEFLEQKDYQNAEGIVASFSGDEWRTYAEEGIPVGRYAEDILVNNYVVADYKLISQHLQLGKSHVRNLILLRTAYARILEKIRPDTVYSNDSYYGMWALWQILCQRRGIPFYSNWSGTRKSSWCYAYNDAAMNLNFRVSWAKYSDTPLDERQTRKVEDWLLQRSKGGEMTLDTASLGSYKDEYFDVSRISKEKPTVLLAANVIWDLAALHRQVIFTGMIEWIAETIEWFRDHPEYQLIIKPHPAELHPSIPATMERVGVAIAQRGIVVPANVFLLSPKVSLTVYDLIPIARVGLVHTTTVGLEMAARGLPVITSGESPYRGLGLTTDPRTKEEYFSSLKHFLAEKDLDRLRKTRIENAYKLIMFYNYHYYLKIDIIDYLFGGKLTIKVKNFTDLERGRNRWWDYVVDSILGNLPILSEERWPPES
jgi:hypothetical protein